MAAVCTLSVRGLDPAEETVSVMPATRATDLCVSVNSLATTAHTCSQLLWLSYSWYKESKRFLKKENLIIPSQH